MRRADEPRPDEYRRAAELREELRRFLRVSERAARGKAHPAALQPAPDDQGRARRAEDAGLIHREPSPRDGRVVFLSLTVEGERRLAATVRELGPERKRLEALFAAPGGRQRRS